MYHFKNLGSSLLTLAMTLAVASPSLAQVRYAMEDATGSDFAIISTEDTDFSDGHNDGDVTVDFAVNYGTLPVGSFTAGIPEAPNTQPGDAARTGLFVSANDDLLTNIIGLSELSLFPIDPSTSQPLSVSGKYEVQVDMWMNFDYTSANATEFGGLLVAHDGVSQGRVSGGGLVYSGDSGAATDFRLQHGPATGIGDPDAGFTGHLRLEGDDDGNGGLTNADGRYNPQIGIDYYADPQFDAGAGIIAALDNENDFWQGLFTDRFDLAASVDPYFSQDLSGPSTINNPPGDPGFRWGTIRIEIDPDEMGTGTRAETGVARVYLSGEWQDDGDEDLATFDPVKVTGDEVLVGTIDNSIDTADRAGFTPAVLDFSDPIALVYADLFPSFEGSGFNFAIFDNLVITPENATVLLGDANDDGTVDLLDLDILGTNFGTSPATFAQGDFNNDNVVDLLDLDILGTNFGAMASSGSSVPEPTAALLLILAIGTAASMIRPRTTT